MEVHDRHEPGYRGFAVPRGISVQTPPVYQGIGNALRHSYTPHSDDVPDDMMRLLAKLK